MKYPECTITTQWHSTASRASDPASRKRYNNDSGPTTDHGFEDRHSYLRRLSNFLAPKTGMWYGEQSTLAYTSTQEDTWLYKCEDIHSRRVHRSAPAWPNNSIKSHLWAQIGLALATAPHGYFAMALGFLTHADGSIYSDGPAGYERLTAVRGTCPCSSISYHMGSSQKPRTGGKRALRPRRQY